MKSPSDTKLNREDKFDEKPNEEKENSSSDKNELEMQVIEEQPEMKD
eukprot:CAMPEP_0170567218 /NCGR_PEP_ID=MMETSP0211-20121228/80339_1 /TAXON_ID=311385 /ORGANISM="Pseudokeronopsis sp., Strain OXSARD2" /LENGTH=46 /DNA_ID= /DNA_START= /DNA_END= /DNA_ORIENTATION=